MRQRLQPAQCNHAEDTGGYGPHDGRDSLAFCQNRFVGGALSPLDYSLAPLTEALRATMQRR